MKKDNIELPSLPDNDTIENVIYEHTRVFIQHNTYDVIRSMMQKYSTEAIKSDRQRRSEPVAWHTEDHLTDKSATTYDPVVAKRWIEKGWPVTPLYHSPQPTTSAQEPSVPEGWKLIPVEPTEIMLEGIRTGSRKDWPSHELCRVRYVAMLSAAPKFGEEE